MNDSGMGTFVLAMRCLRYDACAYVTYISTVGFLNITTMQRSERTGKAIESVEISSFWVPVLFLDAPTHTKNVYL